MWEVHKMEKHKLSFFSAERVFFFLTSTWSESVPQGQDPKCSIGVDLRLGKKSGRYRIGASCLSIRPLLHTTSAADDMIGKCQVDNDEFSIEPLFGSDSRALHTMAPQKNKTADDWIISWSFHLFLSLVANHIPHLTDRMKHLTLVFTLTRVKLF